ncbi:T3SS effector HopA1 family protein [Staphylococcus equorum]|uniref:T3SS effector HopA1 family protein n=1 Tax=Staphylococcus equorum TaxID=246432 RepID=A0A9X4LCJ2_9STAP|nr:T3SS effector HopA1 family protein [Staphylococcus equorum]MDG0843983.1 T3SS effector HopA1 family protein [Staphylococcus equorum]MDG0860274.1 T3SS effector HopA1 family protein [Staphylococcus equorum]
MTILSNSIDNLEKIIKLEADLDQIEINNIRYKGVLEKPKNQLIQWLYSNLHTGNIDSYSNDFIKKLNDLDKKIIDSVEDPGIILKAQKEIVGGKEYTLIHGVRVIGKTDEHESVRLPCFRPNLTPGFFMFVHTENGIHSSPVKRHYIYADNPSYGIDLWAKCVKELVDKNVNFSAKVLSSSDSYPRNDALVFYSSDDYIKVEQILLQKVKENPKVLIDGSLLAKKVYKNLYTAEEPLMTNEIKQSFGENRCNAIADAIQDHFVTSVNFKLLLKQRLISYRINTDDLSENA